MPTVECTGVDCPICKISPPNRVGVPILDSKTLLPKGTLTFSTKTYEALKEFMKKQITSA